MRRATFCVFVIGQFLGLLTPAPVVAVGPPGAIKEIGIGSTVRIVNQNGSSIQIEKDGKVTGTVPLAKNVDVSVTGLSGAKLKVKLTDGKEGWMPEIDAGLKLDHDKGFCVFVGLKKAVEHKLIKNLQITGSPGGDYYGDCLKLTGEAAVEFNLCLKLSPGDILESAIPGNQNMAVRRVKTSTPGGLKITGEVEFKPKAKAEYIVEAYCVDGSKPPPDDQDHFSLKGHDPQLETLLALDAEVNPKELWNYLAHVVESPRDTTVAFRTRDKRAQEDKAFLSKLNEIPKDSIGSVRDKIGKITIDGVVSDRLKEMKDDALEEVQSLDDFRHFLDFENDRLKAFDKRKSAIITKWNEDGWRKDLKGKMPEALREALVKKSVNVDDFLLKVALERQVYVDAIKQQQAALDHPKQN